MYRIELVNKKTKELATFNNLEDVNNGEKLYFKFQINTRHLEDGEYDLSLYDGEDLVATDTLCVGEFDVKGLQYKRGEDIYISTTLNAINEERAVTIREINSTIYPNEGVDVMTAVMVNAQPVYDDGEAQGYADGYGSGYNQGSEDGYNVGVNTQKEKLESIVITANGNYVKEDGYNVITVDVPDINGSYDEGYNVGKTDGLEEGYNNGIEYQKNQLQSATITENGTYKSENGYNEVIVNVEDVNGSYDEGYADGIEEGISNAGELIAETAQVLDITENGLYATKYSKDEDFGREVTGYFDDGTPFYNYAKLNGKVFQTDALVTKDSKIELWWKPSWEWDGSTYDGIFGVIRDSIDNTRITLNKGMEFNGAVSTYVSSNKKVELEDRWYHFVLSLNDGFVIDGEYIGTSTPRVDRTVPGYINLSHYYSDYAHANGYFGMVKVDNNIYIPTENGFINYATNTQLEVYEEGEYVYTGLPPFESNLIRTVNVNVAPKINIEQEGITFAYYTKTEIPEWADFEGITDMKRLFYWCEKFTSIPYIDTSKVVTMYQTFYYCKSLTEIPLLDTSNVYDMTYLFSGCNKLESIPPLNTSKAGIISYMFENCTSLTTIPPLDTSSATTMNNLFGGCTSLTTIPALNAGKVTSIGSIFGYNELKNITNFGGLIGLKRKWDDNYGLKLTPNLTYESCINILNGLYDFVGNNITPSSSEGKLKVHSNFLSLVGDEISIGTNKGWTITA